MTEGLKRHLPVIVVVSLVGIATCVFALTQVLNSAAGLDLEAFSLYIILIPSIVMLVCSFVIALTANSIGRQLYLVVVGICFVTGIVSMVVTSGWVSDASISAQLLANSPEGTTVTPPLQSPLVVLRDLAAYIVAPTVGCIFGAWLGSRIHPVTSDGKGRRK